MISSQFLEFVQARRLWFLIIVCVPLLGAMHNVAGDERATSGWLTPFFFKTQQTAKEQYGAIAPNIQVHFQSSLVAFRTAAGAFDLEFLGTNANPEIRPTKPNGTRLNYLIGNRPVDWSVDLPTYSELTYQGLYPGIDLRLAFSGEHLKSEFELAPGADPRQIRVRYRSLGEARIEPNGDLIFRSSAGEFREAAPVAFQRKPGRSVPVEVRFAVSPQGVIGFELGPYDTSVALTIDPTISYSALLGNNGDTYD